MAAKETTANDNFVILSRPYTFEGKEYTSMDLSGLEDMTTEQMIQAERIYDRSGSVSAMKELSAEYACIVAAQVTGLPVEFFRGLPAKDGVKLKTRVSGYFFGAA